MKKTSKKEKSVRSEDVKDGRSESLNLAGGQLTCIPQDRVHQFSSAVVHLNLSHNRLRRFPGQWIAQTCRHLRRCRLDHNRLEEFDDVLPMSQLLELESLDLSNNPLRCLGNRVYLLETLIGRSSRPPLDDIRRMTTGARQPKVVEHFKKVSTIQRMRQHAQVPRHEGFPMLSELNQVQITQAEMDKVEQELDRKIRYVSMTRPGGSEKHHRPKSAHTSSVSRRFLTLAEKVRSSQSSFFHSDRTNT